MAGPLEITFFLLSKERIKISLKWIEKFIKNSLLTPSPLREEGWGEGKHLSFTNQSNPVPGYPGGVPNIKAGQNPIIL